MHTIEKLQRAIVEKRFAEAQDLINRVLTEKVSNRLGKEAKNLTLEAHQKKLFTITEGLIKEFDFQEHSTPDMWYEVIITFHGKIVERFKERTMRETWNKVNMAGYKKEYPF